MIDQWLDILGAVPDPPLVRLGPDGLEPTDRPPVVEHTMRPLPNKAGRVRGVPDGKDRPRAGYWRRKR